MRNWSWRIFEPVSPLPPTVSGAWSPYVVWLQTGNADKAAVLSLLLDNAQVIQDGFSNGLACVELAA